MMASMTYSNIIDIYDSSGKKKDRKYINEKENVSIIRHLDNQLNACEELWT